MAGVALDGEPQRPGLVAADHDADIDLLAVEHRRLLDMQLEIGVELALAERLGPGIADRVERLLDGDAVVVPGRQHVFQAAARRRRPSSPSSAARSGRPPRWSSRSPRCRAWSAGRDRSACAPPRARTARPGCRRSGRRRSGCRDGCRSRPAPATDRCRRGGRRCCPADRSRPCSPPPSPSRTNWSRICLSSADKRQPPQADIAERADLGRALERAPEPLWIDFEDVDGGHGRTPLVLARHPKQEPGSRKRECDDN